MDISTQDVWTLFMILGSILSLLKSRAASGVSTLLV